MSRTSCSMACEWDGDEEDLAGTSQDNRSYSPRKANALRVVVGIGADVAHTPKTIRMSAMRSVLAVIFRAGEFSDARIARSDVYAGLQEGWWRGARHADAAIDPEPAAIQRDCEAVMRALAACVGGRRRPAIDRRCLSPGDRTCAITMDLTWRRPRRPARLLARRRTARD